MERYAVPKLDPLKKERERSDYSRNEDSADDHSGPETRFTPCALPFLSCSNKCR